MRVTLLILLLVSVVVGLRAKSKAREDGFFGDLKSQAVNEVKGTGNDILGGVKRKATDYAVNKISGSLF